MDKKDSRHELVFEQKAQEVSSLAFVLCEAHIEKAHGKPTPAHTALAVSAQALQKAMETFLAVERLCD